MCVLRTDPARSWNLELVTTGRGHSLKQVIVLKISGKALDFRFGSLGMSVFPGS